MKSRALGLAALSLLGPYALVGQHSQVQVQVTDAFGNRVQAESIKIMGTQPERGVPQDKVIDLEYGLYEVEVFASGAAKARISTLVDQPAQIITVGMKLGAMEAEVPPCTILGHAAPPIIRIRVVQMFGSYMTDVPPGEGGLFAVRGLECGDYLLIGMAPGKFLGAMATRASTLPVRIEMKSDGSAALAVK